MNRPPAAPFNARRSRTRMPHIRSLIALTLAAALLSACGDGTAPEALTVDTVPTDEAAMDGFTIEPVSAEELVGEVRAADAEVVVVNFWASWCVPCRKEFPDFMEFARDHADDGVAVRFVTVDFEDEVDLAAEFLEEMGVTGRTYIRSGKDGPFIDAIAGEWSGSIPATAVFDGAGNRVAFHEGVLSYDELAALVASARSS